MLSEIAQRHPMRTMLVASLAVFTFIGVTPSHAATTEKAPLPCVVQVAMGDQTCLQAHIPPGDQIYPLTITMQSTIIKAGNSVAFIVTVANSATSHMAFGPWVTIDSSRTLLSQECDARTSPFYYSFHPACYIGKLRPGQSRQIVIRYPLSSYYDGMCDVQFGLHDTYYHLQTHIWQCGGQDMMQK